MIRRHDRRRRRRHRTHNGQKRSVQTAPNVAQNPVRFVPIPVQVPNIIPHGVQYVIPGVPHGVWPALVNGTANAAVNGVSNAVVHQVVNGMHQVVPVLNSGVPINGVSVNGLHNGFLNGVPSGVHNVVHNVVNNGVPNDIPNGVPSGVPNGVNSGVPNGVSRVSGSTSNGVPGAVSYAPYNSASYVSNGFHDGQHGASVSNDNRNEANGDSSLNEAHSFPRDEFCPITLHTCDPNSVVYQNTDEKETKNLGEDEQGRGEGEKDEKSDVPSSSSATTSRNGIQDRSKTKKSYLVPISNGVNVPGDWSDLTKQLSISSQIDGHVTQIGLGSLWRQHMLELLEKDDAFCKTDKYLVTVSDDNDFGYVPMDIDEWMKQSKENPTKYIRQFTIKNSSPDSNVILREVATIPVRLEFSVSLNPHKFEPLQQTVIKPNEALTVYVRCSPRFPSSADSSGQRRFQKQKAEGLCAHWMVFVFELVSFGRVYDWTIKRFSISRKNVAWLTDPSEMTILNAEATPFFPKALRQIFDSNANDIKFGIPPPTPENNRVIQLEDHPYPGLNVAPELKGTQKYKGEFDGFLAMTKRNFVSNSVAEDVADHITEQIRLLMSEEDQMQIDIRAYDLFFAKVVHFRDYELGGQIFKLHVPGAGERRPALIVGDCVQLRYAQNPGDIRFEAFIFRVYETEVLINFDLRQYLSRKGLPWDPENFFFHVRFSPHRKPFRLMYRNIAKIASMKHLKRLIFPTCRQRITKIEGNLRDNTQKPREEGEDFKWFDKTVNTEQKHAVLRILNKSGRNFPFIIFGPPGTGKTVTVIEAILQVTKTPGKRVLCVTPSNHSADILVSRLMKHKSTDDLIRINSVRRHEYIKWPDKKYSRYSDESECYMLPKAGDVLKHKIVVCTCIMAGELLSIGIRAGYFDYIFFDEASQAMESESLVPLSLTTGKTRVILAGDYKQLGPITHSALARSQKFKESLLERLMKREPYASRDVRYVTTLVRNYRSHEALLALPSQLYYDESLVAEAEEKTTKSLTAWEHLPNKRDFPILFYGVIGEDVFAMDSNSFYNPIEIKKVVELVRHLLSSETLNVGIADIGIIAPYRKQVLKTRTLLRSHGLGSLTVGAVEDFQGEERRIIIISTTVARDRDTSKLTDKTQGLLHNEKRFNVAITRAKALLVVIGNPYVLECYPSWNELLMYSIQNGAYAGVDCSHFYRFNPEKIESVGEDMQSFVNTIETRAVLGAAAIDRQYPLEPFADEAPWRIML